VIAAFAACGGADPSAETGGDGQAVRSLTAEEYYDKIHGAWLGQAVAGALGMSVEGMHHSDLKPFLTELGQWPLNDYIKTLHSRRDPNRKQWYVADNWGPTGFGPDDDSLYQIANLLLLEEKGPDITSQDIADKWLASFSVFEAQNCGRAVRVAEKLMKEGVKPPESGKHEFGEFMGGQMKGEFWGFMLPGNPAAAAEYGRIDAEVSFHTDGVYGEMFMAAMLADVIEAPQFTVIAPDHENVLIVNAGGEIASFFGQLAGMAGIMPAPVENAVFLPVIDVRIEVPVCRDREGNRGVFRKRTLRRLEKVDPLDRFVHVLTLFTYASGSPGPDRPHRSVTDMGACSRVGNDP